MKQALIIAGVVALLLAGGIWFSNNAQKSDTTVISTRGIHIHPSIEIYIKGEKQTIPGSIGLVGVHASRAKMHTHSADGVIHVESSGIIRENDVMVGRFFELWGKEFSQNQILDEVGEVRMFVNREENSEFENYIMNDRDRIEIRLE